MKKFLMAGMIFVGGALCSFETSVLLVRHGQTDWNFEEKVQGHSDIPLNETGIKQAEETAEKLINAHPDISAIYSSDLSRAYATAEMTAKKFDLSIKVADALREINMGIAEGMFIALRNMKYKDQFEELEKKYSNHKDRWKHAVIPGAESTSEVIDRVKEKVIEICEKHPNQKVAIFSHKRAISAFTADILNKDFKEIFLPNCGIVELVYNSDNKNEPFQVIAIDG